MVFILAVVDIHGPCAWGRVYGCPFGGALFVVLDLMPYTILLIVDN
jgi:hypothetical protein